MKPKIITALLILVGFSLTLNAAPLGSAYEYTSRAKVILTQDKDVLSEKDFNIVFNSLSKAESDIQIMDQRRAIRRPTFLKSVTEAKTAISAAKTDIKQRDVEIKAVDKALDSLKVMLKNP